MTSSKRPNFEDIAAYSGMSPSTVDRVLNNRSGVSERARLRVVEAARHLGARRVLPAIRRGPLQFDVLLPAARTPYVSRLEVELRVACERAALPIELNVKYFGVEDDDKLASFLVRSRHKRHGVLIMAADSPVVKAAVAGVSRAGIPVVTLTTDIGQSQRFAYAGIDHRRAGQAIGSLLARFIHHPGKIWTCVASLELHAHRQRHEGFCEAVRRHAPALQLLTPVQTHDEVELARKLLSRDLLAHPDIVGIYNTGAATSGLCAALLRHPLGAAPVWAGHELTREHAELLRSGVLALVADQSAPDQAFHAVQLLLQGCKELPTQALPGTDFYLVTKENIADSIFCN